MMSSNPSPGAQNTRSNAGVLIFGQLPPALLSIKAAATAESADCAD
jgi:hypothetical protein